MSNDRDTERIVRTWLDDGVTRLPDRVLDAVLDELPANPQVRAPWPLRRIPAVSTVVRVSLAASALVLAIGVGAYLAGVPGANLGGPIQSSPPASPATPAPTPIPTETALPASGELAPGAYVVDDPFPLRVSMRLGTGWRVWSGATPAGAAIYKESFDPPNGRGIIVTIVNNVYADPCNVGEGVLIPELGPGVEDLAAALAGQPLTVASPITDVSLAGYSGKYLEYTVPELDPECTSFGLHRWPSAPGPRQALVDESDRVWILDVDGVRLVIDVFSFAGASDADLAEVLEIVDSIRIAPPGG